ncbi:MAG TPA: translation initiation factor IF-3 [Thermoanaerobaculia bacterium]|nr:translation initiation factor IF-3 [Thermoanaerobaculia bacterium]
MDKKSIRVNEQIRWKEVRLIGEGGEPLGIVAMADALQKARDVALDLVEIAPTANPPVCRIMNFGKFIYQQKKKQQDSKKKQKTTQVKEVKFRPNIDDHDYEFKVKNIVKFLAHGDKVKATVQFRGREMARRENGQKVLDRLLQDLTGKAVAESRSEMLGNRLYQILAPVRVHEKGAKVAASRSADR